MPSEAERLAGERVIAGMGVLDGTRSVVNTILTPTELACLRGEHEPVQNARVSMKTWKRGKFFGEGTAQCCIHCRSLYVARD